MADPTGSVVDLAATWKTLFSEYDPGKESMLGICARFAVAPGSWYYWRTKLGLAEATRRKKSRRPRPAFAELVVREEPAKGSVGIEIALTGGAVVRVGTGASERELAMVLRALGAC